MESCSMEGELIVPELVLNESCDIINESGYECDEHIKNSIENNDNIPENLFEPEVTFSEEAQPIRVWEVKRLGTIKVKKGTAQPKVSKAIKNGVKKGKNKVTIKGSKKDKKGVTKKKKAKVSKFPFEEAKDDLLNNLETINGDTAPLFMELDSEKTFNSKEKKRKNELKKKKKNKPEKKNEDKSEKKKKYESEKKKKNKSEKKKKSESEKKKKSESKKKKKSELKKKKRKELKKKPEETEAERLARLEKIKERNRERKRQSRLNEQYKMIEREKNRISAMVRRSFESEEEREIRRKRDNERKRRKRLLQTEEERARERQRNTEYRRRCRQDAVMTSKQDQSSLSTNLKDPVRKQLERERDAAAKRRKRAMLKDTNFVDCVDHIHETFQKESFFETIHLMVNNIKKERMDDFDLDNNENNPVDSSYDNNLYNNENNPVDSSYDYNDCDEIQSDPTVSYNHCLKIQNDSKVSSTHDDSDCVKIQEDNVHSGAQLESMILKKSKRIIVPMNVCKNELVETLIQPELSLNYNNDVKTTEDCCNDKSDETKKATNHSDNDCVEFQKDCIVSIRVSIESLSDDDCNFSEDEDVMNNDNPDETQEDTKGSSNIKVEIQEDTIVSSNIKVESMEASEVYKSKNETDDSVETNIDSLNC